MLRVISKISIYFITLIILLFFFEFILSLRSSEKADSFGNLQSFHKKYVVFNSHGYRDKEYSYKKGDNIFRILVLGDSQTFGHGIKNLNDTWHKKLEKLMNKGLKDERFEVITLAGEGWNTDKQLYELFKNGFKYNPDLILLTFSQYTVPRPYEFKCQSNDIILFPKSRIIESVRKYSRVYSIFEYRINRLLEILGQKPTYAECINKRFDSRGWDMEEVYLDTILMSSIIKNIHFMITTIPLVNGLNEEYPIKNAHAKIKSYCTKKKITCLDLYYEGFKGLDHTNLVFSISDSHLNEQGTEVVAKSLYKKLKTLKEYKNLTNFNEAFDLSDLLKQKQIIKDLDRKLTRAGKKNQIFKIKGEKENIEFEKQGKKFQYIKIISKNIKPTIYKIKLDIKGNFIESEINYYIENNPNNFYEINKKLNNTNILISGVKKNINKQEIDKIQSKRIFLGIFKNNFQKEIVLFKGVSFVDPKVIEKGIFGTIGIGPKNENRILKALSFYNEFYYKNFTFKGYIKKISNEILRTKPSIAAVRAVNRIKFKK